jgi:hypothetical protein
LRGVSGVLRPVIVVQLLVIMLLAGVGTAFAIDPNSAGPTATPGPSATPVAGNSLIVTGYALVPNPEVTQYIGLAVTVENKGNATHGGIVNVAIDWEDDTITGQGYITDLTAGTTTQITINLEPMPMKYEAEYLKAMRVMVTQTQ